MQTKTSETNLQDVTFIVLGTSARIRRIERGIYQVNQIDQRVSSIHVTMDVELPVLKKAINKKGLFSKIESELPTERKGYKTIIQLQLEAKLSLCETLTKENADNPKANIAAYCMDFRKSGLEYINILQYNLKSWNVSASVEKQKSYTFREKLYSLVDIAMEMAGSYKEKTRQLTFYDSSTGRQILFHAYCAELRVVLEKSKVESIQIQAAFDYEQAKIVTSLEAFKHIKLPVFKENSRTHLYLYLEGDELIKDSYYSYKEDYPIMHPTEIILHEIPYNTSIFTHIPNYRLLAWKTAMLNNH